MADQLHVAVRGNLDSNKDWLHCVRFVGPFISLFVCGRYVEVFVEPMEICIHVSSNESLKVRVYPIMRRHKISCDNHIWGRKWVYSATFAAHM